MPQLDVASYAPQLVWLAISFVILYLLMARIALPRIAGVLEERAKRREDNLVKAEEHERDAAAAAQAYEAALAEARGRAQSDLAKAQDAAKARADAEIARLDATLQARVREAEDAIATARTAALGDAAGIAAEVARLAAHKLAGLTIDETAARSAADAAVKARA
jgi:F-type H+-transporting ATPase subunit b